jgi:hypothetical protein
LQILLAVHGAQKIDRGLEPVLLDYFRDLQIRPGNDLVESLYEGMTELLDAWGHPESYQDVFELCRRWRDFNKDASPEIRGFFEGYTHKGMRRFELELASQEDPIPKIKFIGSLTTNLQIKEAYTKLSQFYDLPKFETVLNMTAPHAVPEIASEPGMEKLTQLRGGLLTMSLIGFELTEPHLADLKTLDDFIKKYGPPNSFRSFFAALVIAIK